MDVSSATGHAGSLLAWLALCWFDGGFVLEVPPELLLLAMDQPALVIRPRLRCAPVAGSASHVLLVRRGSLITNWNMVVHDLVKICVDICRGFTWLFAGWDSIVCKRVYRDVAHRGWQVKKRSCQEVSQAKRWMNRVKQKQGKKGRREVEEGLAKSKEATRIDALMRC